MTEASTDEELVQRMRAGNEAAFTMLYWRWQRGLYRFALRMSGSPSIAEDVTQEVFMSLVGEMNRYDSARGSLCAYLFGIARNQVRRALQKGEKHTGEAGGVEEQQEIHGKQIVAHDPLEDLARTETTELVRQAVLTLPVHYREVVVLCDLQSMTYEQAAAVLECAVGTVRSRLHRAHAHLIEKLRTAHRSESAPKRFSAARCLS
ncbi:MAG TPA: sigma-70 family RNA polymerase sigma factor [Acidobacteriota bacterium]|jgi:RNA polymerase sigma-70 factor (ECF subfamily)|nr:sigma-70 family RNA polymerase sigma factor [Acidobacteriota bacterium]